ncbi:acetyltransferase [Chitinophagaceae bacterium IBVUCB1]|nr:acetyltransferase [Chitinophagaceae bacterium IBVUCB1]
MKKYINTILKRLFYSKRNKMKKQYNRVLPVNELFTDRWEKAKYLGFGEGTSVYDSCNVFGDVKVGNDTWIGPYTILDGTGGLSIGSNCSISAGVHIYTHNTVKWAVSGGKEKYEYNAVSIGDNCFIGPQSMVQNGVAIGKHCIVAANSFVNNHVNDFAIVAGNPAKQIGEVVINADGKPVLKYY